MPTLLCVPIMVQDDEAALRDAREAKDAGADLVEFRIDEIFSGEGDEHGQGRALRLVAESPLPCIVTCRPAWEGGHYEGDESARLALFERLGTAFGPGEHPPRYIDVELAAYTRSADVRQKVNLACEHPEQVRDLQTSLVLSMHDFGGLPADLSRRVLRMRAEPAAKVLKIAFRARSLRDNLELFDLLAGRDRPMIALGMGEFGLPSRVLAPKFGGFLTFASLRPQSTTAPGQPTLAELLETYRFRAIRPSTAVYGVVGWPVAHSLSPLVHNAGFDAACHDGVYLPLPVPTLEGGAGEGGAYENFKATLLELLEHPGLGLRGCSVTIPHKENLVRLAMERGWRIEEAAARIGAANTLSADRNADGSLAAVRISNTDGPALASCLREAVGDLAGLRVAVLGAGGAARAAAVSLSDAGAAVTIFNRDAARAASLVQELGAAGAGHAGTLAAAPLGDVGTFRGGAIVNCTPVGMAHGPAPDESPVPPELLRSLAPGAVVFDTVYTPIRTPLLRAAGDAGLRTIDGVCMFVRQAAAQFQAWTGGPAPAALFDRIVRERLGAQGT